MLNFAARLLVFITVTSLATPLTAKTVELAAGSLNGLGAAIADAGEGGKVIVKSGIHTESGRVVVNIPVAIVGEQGAIIESGISPSASYPLSVRAVVHIKNTREVTVRGIWFRPPAGGTANCAVIIENSHEVRIADNKITQFQFGVFVQHGEGSIIVGNRIVTTSRWTLDPADPRFLPESDGILLNNGRFDQIIQNVVSDAFQGIFVSDRYGFLGDNRVSGCYLGIVLCHNPQDPLFYKVSGQPAFSDTPATGWLVLDNTATNNAWGFLVIDGAHDNVLATNNASNNSVYDMELAGDSNRFGFFAPASYNNRVFQFEDERIVVKKCGRNNVVKGNVRLVNHAADPCF